MKTSHQKRGALLLALAAAAMSAQAQDNALKVGVIRYDTHSKTNGVTGPGVPAGADAVTGDANTLLLTYERLVMPQVGVELVLGVPPKITAKATGSVAFLGEVLSARNVAPTLLVNYHFGADGDRWRPYVGAGINYTRFVDVKTTLPGTTVKLGDSWGAVGQLGVDVAIDRQWGIFVSVSKLKTKSTLVGTGATVLKTTIDFRPMTYQAGAIYRF